MVSNSIPSTSNAGLSLLEHNEALIKSKLNQHISFPKPIVNFGDEGLIYPNTINIIQGKSGVHKSRLEGHMISSLISKNNESIAGFKKLDQYKYKVIMIDTERAMNDLLPYSVQTILAHAGYMERTLPSNFKVTSMANITRLNRLAELKKYLIKFHSELEDREHGIVFLDVISDMIDDFNNITSSLGLVDYLNELINNINLTFIAVIHENPGLSDKSRGHLGSELHNKSSSVIQISGDKPRRASVFQVSIFKNRYGAPIPEQFFTYDSIKKQLVSVDEKIGQAYFKNDTKQKAEPSDVIKSLLERYGNNISFKKKDAVNFLMKHFNCSDKTITGRLSEIIQAQSINGICLKQQKEGREQTLVIESQLQITEEKKDPI